MRWKLRYFPILICLILILFACGVSPGKVEIMEPWARPADSGANSAVYFKIENSGQDDVLISAASEIAERTELHLSIVDTEGNARMEHQDQVDVPSGEEISFAPGGLHVMLINLHESLMVGDTFDLTLNFKKAGEVIINVPVQTP